MSSTLVLQNNFEKKIVYEKVKFQIFSGSIRRFFGIHVNFFQFFLRFCKYFNGFFKNERENYEFWMRSSNNKSNQFFF